jgi:murein DD-endopeptidase MepM/ murein hydrolase activator NlpD
MNLMQVKAHCNRTNSWASSVSKFILFFIALTLTSQNCLADIPKNARVQAGSIGVRVRASAGSSSILGTNNAGTYGTVLSGPTSAKISGSTDQTVYNWYDVNWDSPATVGWSADVGFTQPTPNGPTPQSPGYETSPGQVVGPVNETLKWVATSTADAAVTTGYQVAVYDFDASSTIQSSVLANTSISTSLQLTNGHHYFWIVYALNANLSGASAALYFWVAPIPSLVGPGNSGAPVVTLPNLTPTFYWNALTGAQSYKLYISRSPYGTANTIYSTAVSGGSSALSSSIPANTLPATTACSWTLTAFFNDALQTGVESDQSGPLYFQTPTLYNLTVQVVGSGDYGITPSGDSYLAGTPITLTATAKPGNQFLEWSGSQYSRTPTLTFPKGGADETIQLQFVPVLAPPPIDFTTAISTPSMVGITIPTPSSWITLYEQSSDLRFWNLVGAIAGQASSTPIQLPTSTSATYLRVTYCPLINTPPFLSFPIHESDIPPTPETAEIFSIFDHSGSPDVAKEYVRDLQVRTHRGATYHTVATSTQNETKFNNYALMPSGTQVSSLFTYIGITSQAGKDGLQYDGHPGYDYRYGMDTDVYAAAGGVVMTDADLANTSLAGTGFATYYMNYLHALIINHNNGYCTIYMHLDDVDSPYVDKTNPTLWVPVKATVAAGQHIGLTGAYDTLPNQSVGPHFHFEVWRLDGSYNWRYADPYGYSCANLDGTVCQITPYLWTN